MTPSPILVIAGSVRPRRISIHVARWVAEVGREAFGERLEVVDLKDWPLPIDDEPALPHAGDYQHEHTRAWSRRIAAAGGFVFVTPQYNWGYPAALKNALDHLYREWAGKPALIVAYGGQGGDRCAAQLRQVCEGLHMAPIALGPGLRLQREQISADSGEIDPAESFAEHLDELKRAFDAFATACSAAGSDAAPA